MKTYNNIELTEGSLFIDDSKQFKGLTNLKRNWNGWAVPFIHIDEVESFINEFSDGKILFLDSFKNLIFSDDGDIIVIEQTEIEGEFYYSLEDLVWCFEFTTTKKLSKEQIC